MLIHWYGTWRIHDSFICDMNYSYVTPLTFCLARCASPFTHIQVGHYSLICARWDTTVSCVIPHLSCVIRHMHSQPFAQQGACAHSFIWDMTHGIWLILYEIWLILSQFARQGPERVPIHPYGTWLIHIYRDAFTQNLLDTAQVLMHSYGTWLMSRDSFYMEHDSSTHSLRDKVFRVLAPKPRALPDPTQWVLVLVMSISQTQWVIPIWQQIQ